MNGKRGQGLSTNAIILIILGVVVLVVLIIGFTMGWSKIAPWMSSDNVDTIVQQCGAACSTNSVSGYCSKKRELNDGDGYKVETTCYTFSLDTDLAKYGIDECSIDCKDSTPCVTWEIIHPGETQVKSVKLSAEKEAERATKYCTP